MDQEKIGEKNYENKYFQNELLFFFTDDHHQTGSKLTKENNLVHLSDWKTILAKIRQGIVLKAIYYDDIQR